MARHKVRCVDSLFQDTRYWRLRQYLARPALFPASPRWRRTRSAERWEHLKKKLLELRHHVLDHPAWGDCGGRRRWRRPASPSRSGSKRWHCRKVRRERKWKWCRLAEESESDALTGKMHRLGGVSDKLQQLTKEMGDGPTELWFGDNQSLKLCCHDQFPRL